MPNSLHDTLDGKHTDALLTYYSGDYEVWLEELVRDLQVAAKAADYIIRVTRVGSISKQREAFDKMVEALVQLPPWVIRE